MQRSQPKKKPSPNVRQKERSGMDRDKRHREINRLCLRATVCLIPGDCVVGDQYWEDLLRHCGNRHRTLCNVTAQWNIQHGKGHTDDTWKNWTTWEGQKAPRCRVSMCRDKMRWDHQQSIEWGIDDNKHEETSPRPDRCAAITPSGRSKNDPTTLLRIAYLRSL